MMESLDRRLERWAATADRAAIPPAADVRRRGDSRRRHRRVALVMGSLVLLAAVTTPVALALAGASTRRMAPAALHPTTTRPTRSTSTTIVPPTTSAAPTTTTFPASCQRGSVSVTAPLDGPTTSVCIHAGSMLTVTFDKSGRDIGVAGPWAVPPIRQDSPILGITSTSPRGALLTVVFSAETPGTTMVYASFGESCAADETTPCTIPPLGEIAVDVTVANP